MVFKNLHDFYFWDWHSTIIAEFNAKEPLYE